MAACEGYCRSVVAQRLEPCPYPALWDFKGLKLCFFHLEVAKGLIEASWRPTDADEPERERDQLQMLLEEWL